MSWAFLITSLAIIATPGTGAILTIAAGLRGGGRLAVVTAFGCTLGIVPHLLAAITGTAALLQLGGIAFEVLKYAGVAYLLYLAYATWRDQGAFAVDAAPSRRTAAGLVARAFLLNILNPKLTIFFLAFLPQFVTPGVDGLRDMVALSGTFMALTFVVFTGYGLASSFLRRHVVERPRLVRRVQRAFALGYLGIGVQLASAHR